MEYDKHNNSQIDEEDKDRENKTSPISDFIFSLFLKLIFIIAIMLTMQAMFPISKIENKRRIKVANQFIESVYKNDLRYVMKCLSDETLEEIEGGSNWIKSTGAKTISKIKDTATVRIYRPLSDMGVCMKNKKRKWKIVSIPFL